MKKISDKDLPPSVVAAIMGLRRELANCDMVFGVLYIGQRSGTELLLCAEDMPIEHRIAMLRDAKRAINAALTVSVT